MSRQLLPPPGDNAFGIQDANSGAFTWNDATLLSRLGTRIEVRNADSEGRIPSPASRAFTFYSNLYQRALGAADGDGDGDGLKGRQRLQVEARQTLRGLLATFALRDALGLRIRREAVSLNAQNGSISQALVPALASAPGGSDFWNPVRVYVIEGADGRAETLAGRSPFTGLFPSAKPPRGLTGLYWYVPPVQLSEETDTWSRATWYDPADPRTVDGNRVPVAEETKATARRLLRAWLDTVLTPTLRADLQAHHGMSSQDANALVDELEKWQGELPAAQGTVAVGTDPDDGFPLTAVTVQETAHDLISDLPLHHDRLVVTARDLRSADVRIYGQLRGDRHFTEDAVRAMPASGPNLSAALNRLHVRGADGQPIRLDEQAAPIPYVLIDRLFTPYLSRLTRKALSPEWDALAIDRGPGETPEYALYPFEPEILDLLSPDELRAGDAVTATMRDDGIDVRLTLRDDATGRTRVIPVLYSLSDPSAPHVRDSSDLGGLDLEELDLRFFPDFDLEPLEHLLPADLAADRQYYARLRWLPYWDFQVEAFRHAPGQGVTRDVGARDTVGSEAPQKEGALATGKAQFFTFDERPSGFSFSDRGLCLLHLREVPTGGTPDEWEVGIDFGTSNTCVAYKPAESTEPKILELPIFTTFLFEPNYFAGTQEVWEAGAPALDFFYKYTSVEGDGTSATDLARDVFFPTQFVTQQARMADDEPGGDGAPRAVQSKDAFDVRRGLVHFRNLTSGDPAMWQLIRSYPSSKDIKPEDPLLLQRFSVKSNIKWKEVEWLRVFMHHLRKQVVLTAARRNARIKRVYFSYPKAFTLTRKRRFAADLKRVWGDVFGGTADGAGLVSESEAVRDYVVADANEYVVFDVGGGTSDLIAFTSGTPVFQTSFELAAGAVTRYVAASPTFRRTFLAAFRDEMGHDALNATLARKFEETPAIDDSRNEDMRKGEFAVISQAWVDMLEQLSRKDGGEALSDVLTVLRDEATPGGPVYGFFLTISLLFTGLAYLAGNLMEAASWGKFGRTFQPERVMLRLTGNGSRLYNMLGVPEAPFRDVVVRMFRQGYGDPALQVVFDGIEPYEGREAPKVTVALGLLKLNEHVGADASIPVVNVVGEDGGEKAGTDLFDYYREVAADPLGYTAPRQAPPQLADFLRALGEALPYGRNGSFAVVAGARQGWADQLADDVYRTAIPAIKTRVTLNARKTNELTGVPEDERPALEPLFVVELAALLDAVRQTYGS